MKRVPAICKNRSSWIRVLMIMLTCAVLNSPEADASSKSHEVYDQYAEKGQKLLDEVNISETVMLIGKDVAENSSFLHCPDGGCERKSCKYCGPYRSGSWNLPSYIFLGGFVLDFLITGVATPVQGMRKLHKWRLAQPYFEMAGALRFAFGLGNEKEIKILEKVFKDVAKDIAGKCKELKKATPEAFKSLLRFLSSENYLGNLPEASEIGERLLEKNSQMGRGYALWKETEGAEFPQIK